MADRLVRLYEAAERLLDAEGGADWYERNKARARFLARYRDAHPEREEPLYGSQAWELAKEVVNGD